MKFFLRSKKTISLTIVGGALLIAGFMVILPNLALATGTYFCGYIGGMNGSTTINGAPPWWPIADPRCAPTIQMTYTGQYPGPGVYAPEVTGVDCVWLGPMVGGYFCSVTMQFNDLSCDVNTGNACSSSANACGQSSFGTIQCNGSCDAGASPPAVDQCTGPKDPGLQCSLAQCSPGCSIKQGTACSASNACGVTNNGTFGCDGATCSVSAPALPPGYGTGCVSAANKCGMTNPGSIDCSGSCNASAPLDSACSPGCGVPSVTISATPVRVNSGGIAHLTVSGTGITTSCTVSGPGVNQILPPTLCNTGAVDIVTPAIKTQSTYTVSCDAGAAVQKVIVNVNPTFKPF